MATMNISIPADMRSFVEEETSRGGYASTSEYLRAIIRKEREARERESLERKLEEGLASGPATPWMAADRKRLRKRLLATPRPASRR
ncbi:MAG: type II toxin-antitoxin system ParD family antitoxin [Myxococcales bacterium]|nr:type II toxin-antitoxin system ParD family antitoxin [Myxococcales bacterium]